MTSHGTVTGATAEMIRRVSSSSWHVSSAQATTRPLPGDHWPVRAVPRRGDDAPAILPRFIKERDYFALYVIAPGPS